MSREKYLFLKSGLKSRMEKKQLRRLRNVQPLAGGKVRLDGRIMRNFSSNDYLGLSFHPLLKEKAVEYMEKYGNGSGASRLICGNFDAFGKVEERLAYLKGKETALIINSGYQANVSFIPAIAGRNALVVADRLSHNSIIQGALLSRSKFVRYRHNDMIHLRQILKNQTLEKYSRVLIITESVFSMDGDRSDISQLEQIAEEYGAILIVDEAHATGVLGENGMGLCCGSEVDLVMGTFGKACGSFGAYIACSAEMKDYLINYCSGLIYSTALPPSVVGMIDAALEIIPQMHEERDRLSKLARSLRESVEQLGFNTGRSDSQIIPLIVGADQDALDLSQLLEKKSILASAIRSPTVEAGQARIRLALSAVHGQKDIECLLGALTEWKHE